MALRDPAQPTPPRRFTPSPAPDRPFDPSQLTDAKAQIEYLVNTGKLSVSDANAALKPYGAKLREVDGSPGYYNVTGDRGLMKNFVLPAAIMVGGAVGVNVLANALAAGAPAAAGASSATPTLATSTSLPASVTSGGLTSLAAPPAVGAAPAFGASVGPGVGFGAGGTPVASGVGTTATGSAPGVVAGAAKTMPFWQKAALGFGVDALKTYLGNRASGKANDALQAGGDKALAAYKDALGPYMNLGANAAGSLGYLMGIGPMPGSGTPAAAPPTAATATTTGRTRPESFTAPSQGTAVPRPPQPSMMADPQGMAPPAQTLATMGRSSYRVQAPDGEVGDVPAGMLQKALSMGGRMVG